MNHLVASIILFFCTLQTFGQQDYFVYVQTDNNQAFYLRSNNTVYSSTASGYCILSKLPDSTANVTIGFAKMVFPEQQFTIPVNHKDAGYLLKNFGEKGWGLFNLQTMAVIMNSNATQEKKSPEINSSRKNDDFSLLLANAVNDTAVLYMVNKPAKVLPPEPVAVVEKKKAPVDTVVMLPTRRDSSVMVLKKPVSNDSAAAAKNNAKPVNDSISTTLVKPVTGKLPSNNKKAAADSVSLAKNAAKKAGKQTVVPSAKDTLVNGSNSKTIATATTAVTTKPARKDTIIMMSDPPDKDLKQLAEKEAIIAAARKKDSLQLAKKQAGKNSTAAKKQAVAALAADSIKKDTLVSKAGTKKDTVAVVKHELPAAVEEKKETATVEVPQKRTKPLVYKAADLLTDTSYVAVFVDESKEKFDTIRISIGFNEAVPAEKKEVASVKEAMPRQNPVAAKKVIDSLNNLPAKAGDTARETAEREKLSSTKVPQTVIAPVKSDSSPVISKPEKESPPAATQPVLVKKDSPSTTVADSSKPVKTTANPLFLNSDCKETAQDADIDKLRIKMLLVASDEEKIALAKKVIRQKCLLTIQVKALSELFKTDEGKYKWFDAVYAFVADNGNFSKLSELLKDEYYLNRFKAMLRN